MFLSPPPLTKNHWVYDDPSGVPEPNRYARPWPRREPRRRPSVTVRRSRIAHREA